jgi:multisubunit Na+/H+ antiporter MnhB subunit
MELTLIFDLILLFTLLCLAWLLLASTDLFRAVVLFIAFGLLLALAWVRLGAPDVAMAEAAIGAGITGALLLIGLGQLGSTERFRPQSRPLTFLQRLSAPVLIGVIIPSVAAIIVLELRQLQVVTSGQQGLVQNLLSISGSEHPVTAVLLNFRAWDTLLEKGVLLLALITIWSLDQARPRFEQNNIPQVLSGFGRLLLPLLILFAGVLLWQGAYIPGGAFQAGALLTAAMLLATLCGHTLPSRWSGVTLRLILVAGFLVFLLVAAFTLLLLGEPLLYPQRQAGGLILLIEIVATLSVAAILSAELAGGHPQSNLPTSAKPTTKNQDKS